MKNPKRILLGVVSTLLFALGFTRTAEQLDPVSRSLDLTASKDALIAATDCTTECAFDDHS